MVALLKGKDSLMKSIMKTKNGLSKLAVMMACLLAISACAILLVGCGSSESQDEGKTFVYGTTGYGVEMDDAGLNPHDAYSGWSAVRYGVGETLFKFSDDMQPEPWLAESYEFTDDTHCRITLRDGITFTSGRALDGQAVKECLDDLIANHQRAAADLKISSIEASGNTVTITTSQPCPSLINYLCDPYGAIIDMQAGISSDGNVSGTGPYTATAVSDTEITLTKNENYWDGEPKLDKIVVRSITDGDTLTTALQSGEIDAAYGMPYASYELFSDESNYTIASCDTTRTFFGQVNSQSPIMQDEAVRQALAMGIDKEGFISTLLNNRGVAAVGPFSANLTFGDSTVTSVSYDPDQAKQILEQDGWVDSDGDGIREKNGKTLTIRWLTYPGRMELPLLAESAQATLKDIGFDIQVNSTANHTEIRKDLSAWDVYVSALVTAPTGDPEYFFSASCLTDAAANYGMYSNPDLDALAQQLHTTFDSDERAALATQMQQMILDDYSYFFASHLTMGIVSKAGVSGIEPHPCDYYEITADLDVA